MASSLNEKPELPDVPAGSTLLSSWPILAHWLPIGLASVSRNLKELVSLLKQA